jgi:GMP synthase (glutamine-hydrolysing)
MGPLSETTDPEAKRNIIGHLFIETLKEETRKLGLDFDTTFIAQGTLRPDLIESGNPGVSMYAHKIKTHHNDVEIVREAREKGLVIETNWDWHKDEVRQVARVLGIEEAIASRQPFPGPGLAIRCICTDEAPVITGEERRAFSDLLLREGREYDGAVVPVSTVGVQGDCRSYRYLAVLAQKEGTPDAPSLYSIGTVIPNTLVFINRVAVALNVKGGIDDIRVHRMRLGDESIGLLREIDALVREYLEGPGVSQVFAVLLPFGIAKKRSVAIRAFVTNDFMTGRPAIIGKEIGIETIRRLVERIETEHEEIDLVLYDVTSKPPATVEWE